VGDTECGLYSRGIFVSDLVVRGMQRAHLQMDHVGIGDPRPLLSAESESDAQGGTARPGGRDVLKQPGQARLRHRDIHRDG